MRIVRIDQSGQQVDPIAITDNVANYIRGKPGQYYPVYSDGNRSENRYCLIQNAADSLGQMMIRTVGTDIEPDTNPSRQETIPYRMDIQFQMPDHILPLNQFQDSGWYEYELQGNIKTSTITNSAGSTVSLKDLTVDPAKPDNEYVFRLSDQRAIPPGSSATMVFRMTLNGMNYELPYSFEVQDYPLTLQLPESSVQRNGDLILTVKGTPFMQYDLSLPVPENGEDFPFFDGGGWDEPKISDYHVRAHPEWNGEVQLNIHIPEDAPPSSYTISATGPDIVQPVKTSFYVEQKVMTLIFDEPDQNQYAIGDIIKMTGTLKNIDKKDSGLIPIYLFVTGPNLPPNGASLTDPSQEVVDGDPNSFTVTAYSTVLGIWEYYWETSRFCCDEGTYTVHANLQPIGYQKSSYPGAPGSIDGEVPPSWEYELSSPTLQAKFDENTGGIFARGDYLYSWWFARGSPGSTEMSSSNTGHMKWYIFGPNFRYADFNPRFPLEEFGEDEKKGSYGITHARNFTYDLTPGDYFIVYQHPGHDGHFNLLPENNLFFRGTLNKVFKADGTLEVNLGNLDARYAADAMVQALDSPNIDDTFVMDTFTVEDPLIRIQSPGELVVGDELVVEGKTNLAGKGKSADGTPVGDKLVLTITALDLYDGGKANTVMKIPIDYTYPGKYDPSIGFHSFSYSEPIDTSSWYPGMYEIRVECKDVKYRGTTCFELHREGSQRTASVNEPEQDPSLPLSPDSTFTPDSGVTTAPVYETTPTTSAPMTTTQSPGFGACLAVAAVIGALVTRRR